MRMKFLVTAVAGSLALFVSAASASSEVIEQGKTLYENRCVHCHGKNADGDGQLIEYLNVKPANILELCAGSPDSCIPRCESGTREQPIRSSSAISDKPSCLWRAGDS